MTQNDKGSERVITDKHRELAIRWHDIWGSLNVLACEIADFEKQAHQRGFEAAREMAAREVTNERVAANGSETAIERAEVIREAIRALEPK